MLFTHSLRFNPRDFPLKNFAKDCFIPKRSPSFPELLSVIQEKALSALRIAYKQLNAYDGDGEIFARLSDIYEMMNLQGTALNWWFRFLDIADEEDLPEVYEGLAVNFLNLGQESASAYYYNKLGVRMAVDNATLKQIKGSVKAGELSGNITITSPLPTNKTIRYIEFVITNEDGSTPRRVMVAQYPLEYITNIQSAFSYRDDFKDDNTDVTTYHNMGSKETAVSVVVSGGRWTGYTYHKGSSNQGFWRSKAVLKQNQDGTSQIGYYYWNDRNSLQTTSTSTNNNARMYHIRITSTSNEYKLGNPKLTDDGYTDPSRDNALLVSPSFMIASGLGFMDSNTGNLSSLGATSDEFRAVMRDHCSKYVEVYQDPDTKEYVVLDDWRLPTEAELRIIMNYQGTSGSDADAIDYLLNAQYYWAANGRVENSKTQGNNGITATRCIRDAIAK